MNRGMPVDEIVEILLDETRRAAGEYGTRWNWQREEREIRRMCRTWGPKAAEARKGKVAAERPAPALKAVESAVEPEAEAESDDGAETSQEPAATGTDGAQVVDLTARRKAALSASAAGKKLTVSNVVADLVVDEIKKQREDIILNGGEAHIYRDGIWAPLSSANEQWIRSLIQAAFEGIDERGDTRALNGAWKRLMEHPRLLRREVEWNPPGIIVAANGVLRLDDMSFGPHKPEHLATRKIGATYDATATCPGFEAFLAGLFQDREPATSAAFIATIQEWLGAALAVTTLAREERRALILVGPSRTGKTEFARIVRLLVGEPVASPSVAEIAERFGLSSFYGAAAWVRDDAINEGDKLDPQKFKTIVTGEPVDIDRKNRDAARGVSLQIPVLLTTNALPRTNDKSDAVFNRSLILDMQNVISEDEAAAARKRFGVPRGTSLGAHLFKLEGPGILNWALTGLKRLSARGHYELPPEIKNLIQRFKDDNNPVGEWVRLAVKNSAYSKVSRHDLLCAYHGWQREQDGEEARAIGGRAFFPRLRSACPGSAVGQEHDGTRYITDIALTDEGLQLWQRHNDNPLKGGSKGNSPSKSDVNKQFATEVQGANGVRF
jgi:P4 family phage/plasmid primase-like protien